MSDLPNKFKVSQEIEGIEVLTPVETDNKYSIWDENGNEFLYAYEKSRFIGKQLLSNRRNLNLHILDINGQEIFSLKRPFYILKSKAHIVMGDGSPFGSLIQKIKVAGMHFDFISPNGETVFSVDSTVLHPWTFKISMNGEQVAQITKKWGGLGKESFTDADNFEVDVTNIHEDSIKYAILITTLLIDLTAFEKHS